uniref:Cyclase family protein n=1 Tax=Candidatus Methanosuratincola petrocarbonis (ex Vanwonterghem et al. 2016) TaxID=1867261 RepID=A0A7J3V0P2_9CREN
MMVVFSYSLNPDIIVMPPGGIAKPEIIPRSRTMPAPPGSNLEGVRWSSYNNTSFVKFFAHTGTHIDTPFHIDGAGSDLGAFVLEDFVFEQPLLLEIPKTDRAKITRADLLPYEKCLAQADLLLVYTGFSRFRSTDPDRYINNQPGFTVEAAEYLMQFSRLRCVAIDLMGIENIAEGRAATPPFPVHRAFLLKRKKFLILEDANLAPLVGRTLKRAFLIPIMLPGVEAMPVTAFAETD